MKTLQNTNPDEINCNLFDPLIKSKENEEKCLCDLQYTKHLATINHIYGMIDGELEEARCLLNDLEKDRTDFNKQLEELLTLQKERNIR